MPDLPELYEALNVQSGALLLLLFERENIEAAQRLAPVVSALCAAIEVKQTQELHEYLNSETTTTETQEDSCKCCEAGHGISSFIPRIHCNLCNHPYTKKDGSPMFCTWPEEHEANKETTTSETQEEA